MKTTALFAALALPLSISAAAAADSPLDRVHRQWESRVLGEADTRYYRALTAYSHGNDYVVLTMDRYHDECDLQYVGLNVVVPSPMETDFEAKDLEGWLQIDNGTAYPINFNLSADAGGSVVFTHVTKFPKKNQIFDELIGGRRARFTLTLDEGKRYLVPFSLMGYTAAQNRTLLLCENGGREPPKPKPKPQPAPLAPPPEANPF